VSLPVGQDDAGTGPLTLVRAMQSKTETLFLQSKTLQQEVNRLKALHPVISVVPRAPSLLGRIWMRVNKSARRRYDLAVLRGSGLFDPAWYVAHNRDVAQSGVDPAVHFLEKGGPEWRDPGPHFSTGHYMRMYPDIAALQLNPLLHYIHAGWAEGRAIRPEMQHGQGALADAAEAVAAPAPAQARP